MKRTDFDRSWRERSEEVITGMKEWRLPHPKATFAAIASALDERLAALRARMLQDAALASAASGWTDEPEAEWPVCPECGQRLTSDKTYGRRVTSLKAFFRWATPMAELRADPSETILQLSVRSPLPEILTDEEVEKCLAAGEILRRGEKPDLRPLVLFKLLLDTGLKKVEVANLKKEHIDLAHPADLHLYVRYPDKKDWPKERKLKLTAEWVGLYRDYLAEYAPKDAVFPWSVRKLEMSLGEVGVAAGLNKNVSFDTMRWTCAVRDYKAKMEEDVIRRKMGLSPIQWRETGSRIKKLVEGEE